MAQGVRATAEGRRAVAAAVAAVAGMQATEATVAMAVAVAAASGHWAAAGARPSSSRGTHRNGRPG